MVDIGGSGRHSDEVVLSNSRIRQKFTHGTPPPANLSGSNIILPYYFAADDAFPLKLGINKHKPYPSR